MGRVCNSTATRCAYYYNSLGFQTILHKRLQLFITVSLSKNVTFSESDCGHLPALFKNLIVKCLLISFDGHEAHSAMEWNPEVKGMLIGNIFDSNGEDVTDGFINMNENEPGVYEVTFEITVSLACKR